MPRRHISKIRSKSAFQRRPGQREPRSITLIVCEGETEQEYFEAARIHYHLTTAQVVIADNSKGSAPISVVECAEERAAEQGGYDTIFCVFDRDGHESFDRARAKIRGLASRSRNRLNVHEAISVPLSIPRSPPSRCFGSRPKIGHVIGQNTGLKYLISFQNAILRLN